jgi:FMN phosphatase YigB (HAD superfamily)
MKYVAFDIGDVLCYCDEGKFLNAISEAANITYKEAVRFFQRFWELHDLGFTTIESELQDKLGIKSEVSIKKLSEIWSSTLIPDTEMIKFVLEKMFVNKSLSTNVRTDLRIALLSNIGKEHAAILKKTLDESVYNAYGLFDECIKHFSCEVGARKPSFIYYQSFLSMNPEFKGCVYVDDRKENLIAGEKMGFKPFHFSLKEYYEEGYLSYRGDLRNRFEDKLNELGKLIG